MSICTSCTVRMFEEAADMQEAMEESPLRSALNKTSQLMGLALFIISCLGAAGVLPSSTTGWVAIGLGGGMLVCNYAFGKFKERPLSLATSTLACLLPIIIGTLGVTGVLIGRQVGAGLLGASFASGMLLMSGVCVGVCKPICCPSEEDKKKAAANTEYQPVIVTTTGYTDQQYTTQL